MHIKVCPALKERIKLMTIIDAKIEQNGIRSKCATLFALSGLALNYDLYRLQSY